MFKLIAIRITRSSRDDWLEHSRRDGVWSASSGFASLSFPDFIAFSEASGFRARLHQAAASQMQQDELFETFQIRTQVTGLDIPELSGHLVPIGFPVANKMRVALVNFKRS